MREALAAAGLPADAVQLVPGTSHEAVKHLMTARGLVDVLIPRGGAALIRSVVEESTVPVIETGVGNCHVYVDAHRRHRQGGRRPGQRQGAARARVCNAAETFLVHADIADAFLPEALAALRERGRHRPRRRADARRTPRAAGIGVRPGHRRGLGRPSTTRSTSPAGVVDSLDDAIAHIRRWSSGHTETIVTDSQSAARRFVAAVDSAAVMVNASTRFTDGGEFGFGAEIGISTQKLHARGPMGLAELTSTKYVVTGDGHLRG